MPTPSYNSNMRKWSGVYFGPTRGKSSPKNSRRGCLCLNEDRYDIKCCNGALQEQGTGQIQSSPAQKGAFSTGFSTGFDIGTNL